MYNVFINNTYKVRKTGNCVFKDCLKHIKIAFSFDVNTGLRQKMIFARRQYHCWWENEIRLYIYILRSRYMILPSILLLKLPLSRSFLNRHYNFKFILGMMFCAYRYASYISIRPILDVLINWHKMIYEKTEIGVKEMAFYHWTMLSLKTRIVLVKTIRAINQSLFSI